MNRRNILSAYTPSNTDPELLERVFVQRQRLRDKLVQRLARSATTGDKHHALLIGPRGCGKTHLITLIVHDLKQGAELSDILRVAWLGEDDTFAQPIHLALAIADELAKQYEDEFVAEPRDAVRGLSPTDAANAVLQNIVTQLGSRTLLVVTENFDRTLRSFGDLGQKQWRAFLQETTRFATLATAQQLTGDMSSRDKAFFGFFDIHHLKPLSVDDAHHLIQKIARAQGNAELAGYLETTEGRYRVRALHHLAGGNHRMYVLLAEFLTREALDDLVAAFEGVAEELTPYFQERLRSLSPQQATLVECLCSHARAMTVKEIAETTFVEERTCAKQLGNLKRKGYVVSNKRGKESYYDMAEPLMRLSLEVKNQRGRPLKTLARFLRAWFPEEKLRAAEGHSSRTDAYLKAALTTEISYRASIARDLRNEIQQCLEQKLFDEAAGLADQLTFIHPDAPNQVAAALIDSGIAHIKVGDTEKAVADFTQVIQMGGACSAQVARSLFNRGLVYGGLGDTHNEIADFTRVIELADARHHQVVEALTGRLRCHQTNEPDLADFTGVTERIDQVVYALILRGLSYGDLSETEKAVADLTHVFALTNAPAHLGKAFMSRAFVYDCGGDAEKAIADYTRAIELTNLPTDHLARGLTSRAFIYKSSGNNEKAIADYTRVIELPEAPVGEVASALEFRGMMYDQFRDKTKAIADFTCLIELPGAPFDQVTRALFGRGVACGEVGEFNDAITDLTHVIERPGTPLLFVGFALRTRGAVYYNLGDHEKARADFTRVIELADAPPYLVAEVLNNRSIVHSCLGDFKKSRTDLTRVITLPDAPPDQVARARLYRGLDHYETGRNGLAERAFRESIATAGIDAETKTSALFALPEVMVATSDIGEVATALTAAFEQGDPDWTGYGGTPKDLLAMVLRQKADQWKAYTAALTPLYAEHGQISELGYGLTQSITVLDEEQFSESKLDLWHAAWQQARADHEDLEIPLKSLDAAIDVIKIKSDRPLFRLPPEIRELIRPLLKRSLGEE